MRSATTTSTTTGRHVRRGLALLALVVAVLLCGPAASAFAQGPVAAVTSGVPVVGQAAAPVADTADRAVTDVRASVPKPVRHVVRQSATQGSAAVAQTQAAAAAPAAAAVTAVRATPVASVVPPVQQGEGHTSSVADHLVSPRRAHHEAHATVAPRSRASVVSRHSADGRTAATPHRAPVASHRSGHAGRGEHVTPSARDLSTSHMAPEMGPAASVGSVGSSAGTGLAPVAALACLALLVLAPRRRGARLRLPSVTWTPTVLLLSIERPD
jgi:hypothetical protein